MDPCGEIGEKEKLIQANLSPCNRRKEKSHKERNQQRGQDTGCSLDVERAPERIVGATTAKDGSDQKTRQNEKQRDTLPAEPADVYVDQEDQDNREGSYPV